MTTPTPEATSPKFVEELNVCLNIETFELPVSRIARVHVEKADYHAVMLTVGDGNGGKSGVFFAISETTGGIKVELFTDSDPENSKEFALRGGEWVAVELNAGDYHRQEPKATR